MPFVKMHSETLDSTIWRDPVGFRIFMAALFKARPAHFTDPQPVLEVDSLEEAGIEIPPGVYGFARVAGTWLVDQARCKVESEAWDALRRLCAPEEISRTETLGGRRLVRINGGYVVVNFMRYRENDSTAAVRQRRQRQRAAKKQKAYRDRQRRLRESVTGGGGNGPVTPGNALPASRSRTTNEPAQHASQPETVEQLQQLKPSRRDVTVTGRDDRDTRSRPVTPGNASFFDNTQTTENKPASDDSLNQQEAEAEADHITTDYVPARKRAGTWSEQACDDWNERFGEGTAHGERIGRGLKRIVDKYTWEVIRPAWRYYLKQKDPEFANPQDFASKLKIWLDRKTAGQGKSAAIQERSRAAILEWLQGENQ